MRRIAIVTEFYYPHIGGVCEHVHYFAREARRRGHHVDIITGDIPGAEPDPGVIRIGRSRTLKMNHGTTRVTLGVGLRKTMRETLRRGQYDIVHVHSPLTPMLPVLAIDEATVPVVGTFHTYLERSLGLWLFQKPLQKRMDRLAVKIAVSQAAAITGGKYFDATWRVVPNGVDTTFFSPSAPPPAMRTDVPTLLFLHRLEERNALGVLIEAHRRVRELGRKARLLVVGDGPLRKRYERMTAGDEDVVFVGAAIQGRPSYYAHSTIYVCPTTIASFGITLLEAMACGTPIVCSDIDGFREVVANGREALMVPPFQPRALADAIVQLLDDASLREELVANGRARVARFDWTTVTDSVLAIYDEVLGREQGIVPATS